MLLVGLVTLLAVKMNAAVFTEYYVTPNKTVGCSSNRSQNCPRTLQEYASQPDVYFTNDTIFYFEPGEHKLNSSLQLENLNNVTLQGLPGSSALVVISFEASVAITWERCSNVEISSVIFLLLNNFTHVIEFNQTKTALLHDISIINSDDIVHGCSSILCQQSEVSIIDCYFWGIHGSLGAAMFISESNATFSGNMSFIINSATYGGSLYLFKSSVLLKGFSLFANNNSSKNNGHENDCCYSKNQPTGSSGGAIFCDSSTLTINDAIFYKNFALQGKGGAISAENGDIVFQGTNYLISNFAPGGGAMLLNGSTVHVKLNRSVYFINNGPGAIGGRDELLTHLRKNSELNPYEQFINTRVASEYQMSSIFYGNITCENSATLEGGAIRSDNSSMTVNGEVQFRNNTAFHGGAIF